MASRRSSTSESCSSSDTGSDPENFSDWASSLHGARRTKSLFDETVLDSPEECLEYDERVHSYNVKTQAASLGSDDYIMIRLVNYIRRENPSIDSLKSISSEDPILKDDGNLKVTLDNDPLLQMGFSDSWSEDEEDIQPAATMSTHQSSNQAATRTVTSASLNSLQVQLSRAEAKSKQLQSLLDRMMLSANVDEESEDDDKSVATTKIEKGKGKGKEKMDIDTHYFDSYASNDIHETMLKDTVRTMSYGEFILNNPDIFKGAIVMDVGCGSGILSMFAAKAGAKHVYAIEASNLAHKARRNITQNGLDSVITVLQGKVEEIQLPVKEVDVIVSEWMGYMLLYESMLDSVLHARDRFMRPGGLMVPSQTRIVLAGMTGDRLFEEGLDFWHDVYGFNLSPMKPTKFEDGVIEVVDSTEVVTSECVIKDINTNTTTVPDLDFHSTFKLEVTQDSQMRGFLTWFDTFFSPDSSGAGQAALEKSTDHVRYEDDAYKRAIPLGELQGGKEVSFTTGPRGKPTHWKQVAFILKEALQVRTGQTLEGTFNCRKSRSGNTRELDVELHWKLLGQGSDEVQRYDVFRVC